MKLKTVEAFEFKSIRGSNPFEVGEITCLVGKNEAGKTAVLKALYRLNPLILYPPFGVSLSRLLQQSVTGVSP